MLTLEDAQNRLLDAIQPLPPESIPLRHGLGRFLARDQIAPLDLPLFDNSAMDGYAVQAKDVAQATENNPVPLKLVAQVPAGTVAPHPLQPGQCIRIYTGSAVPEGADAVVMQEDTTTDPAHPGQVLFLDRVKPWENLRLRGEDIKQGKLLIRAGERINASRLALIGAMGQDTLQVGTRPMVGIMATGSELLEPGQIIQPGKIFESNRLMLATLAAQVGARTKVYPLVPDSLADTQTTLETALQECDAVVTSGGVSVGDLDFVKPAFEKVGGKLDFWKVAMKPGKPFVFGSREGVFWFGLPGNPVSALVTFLMLAGPALLKMQGATQVQLPATPGILGEPVSNPGDRRHFMRVHLDRTGHVFSTGTQASHIMSSLAAANGLIDVPPQTEWAKGERVMVLSWN